MKRLTSAARAIVGWVVDLRIIEALVIGVTIVAMAGITTVGLVWETYRIVVNSPEPQTVQYFDVRLNEPFVAPCTDWFRIRFDTSRWENAELVIIPKGPQYNAARLRFRARSGIPAEWSLPSSSGAGIPQRLGETTVSFDCSEELPGVRAVILGRER
jgi:hypothetical protein